MSDDPKDPRNARPDSVLPVLRHVQAALLECWRTTGFGELTVVSERIKRDRVRVLVKGPIIHRFVVREEDVLDRPIMSDSCEG